jgi:hypothetical protein
MHYNQNWMEMIVIQNYITDQWNFTWFLIETHCNSRKYVISECSNVVTMSTVRLSNLLIIKATWFIYFYNIKDNNVQINTFKRKSVHSKNSNQIEREINSVNNLQTSSKHDEIISCFSLRLFIAGWSIKKLTLWFLVTLFNNFNFV